MGAILGKINRSVTVVFCPALLSECGGGGGGDAVGEQTVVTPSALISDATAPDIITSTFNASEFSSLLGLEFLLLISELYSTSPIALATAPADTAPVASPEINLATAVVKIADRFLNFRGQIRVSPTVVIEDERINCDTGFFVFNGNIETLDRPTAGDRLELAFSSCNGLGGQPGFLNGGMTLRIVRFDPNRLTMQLDFDNLRLRDALYDGTADGDLRLDLRNLNGPVSMNVITAGRLSVSEDGLSYVLNGYESIESFGSIGSSISTDGSGDIRSPQFDNKWISFLIEEDLVREPESAYPRSGVMVIFGADDSSVRLTALSDSMVQIEIDADGDTVYESLSNADWADVAPPAPVF